MKACFMGLGYIGLPTAIIAAKHGVQVTGVDINPKVVELTNKVSSTSLNRDGRNAARSCEKRDIARKHEAGDK